MASTSPDNRRTATMGSPVVFVVLVVAFVVVGALLMYIAIENGLLNLILPPQASAEAEGVDELFTVLLVIGTGVFLLVEGLLVYSIIRFRRRDGDESDGANVHGNVLLEIVWTLIPAITVTVLAILSYQVWITNQTVKADENLVGGSEISVRAVGQRYAWTFTYETDEDNTRSEEEGDTVTFRSNVLHTYVDQNVFIKMTTPDVIHSFWVPAMRIKQDLLPGYETEVRFTPTLAGVFPLRCTELCGDGHGAMVTTVVVHEDQEAYLADFYDRQVELVLNAPDISPELGEFLLASGEYPCSSCHTLDALGWTGLTGPSLNGVGERAIRRIAGMSAEEYLAQSLRDPQGYIVPGYDSSMPQFGVPGSGATNEMPKAHLESIVLFLCDQLEAEGNETACVLDNVNAATELYE